MTRVIAGSIASGGAVAAGWIAIDAGRVVDAGRGEPAGRPDERPEGIVAPGLCDLQVNGAAGVEVAAGEAALDAIDRVQLARGVTSYLPTLVSPEDETAERVLGELAARTADPASPVEGAHVEGPFINPDKAGIHSPQRLRVPADGVPAWIESPAVRVVTLAPELPGALDLVRRLSERGTVVSLGHSLADAATARAAIDAGASAVTHVFNAMAPLDHRAPGLVGIALTDARVRVAAIADGIHLDSSVLELVRRAAGPRAMLVSDATPAAGAAPGRFEFGSVAIEAGESGAARGADGRLAGSSITLDEAMRNWTAMTEATLAEAVAAASEAPGAAIGLRKRLRPGEPADLVLLSDDGKVERVMKHGRWIAT